MLLVGGNVEDTSMPASLDACRECIDSVSELTGDDNVVGDDDEEDEEEELEENDDGETDGDTFDWSCEISVVVVDTVIAENDMLGLAGNNDWLEHRGLVGDKLDVSVNIDDTIEMLSGNTDEAVVFETTTLELPLNTFNSGVFDVTYLNGK